MRRHTRMALLTLALGWAIVAPRAQAAPQATVELSSQAAQHAVAVSGTAPTITAPPTATNAEGQTTTLTATAMDADGGDLLTITESGAPAGLTFNHTPTISPATATLSGTLGSGDIGFWSIHWSVTDGIFVATTNTDLTVTEQHPPVVNAPPSISSAVAMDIAFGVTATDQDNEPIDTFTATGVPSGASFTVNSFRTSGEFDWTPVTGQEGDYSVTFTATAGFLSGMATTAIHIAQQDHPAVVTGPSTVTGFANALLTINVTVSDADGDPITDLHLEGSQMGPPPAGMTFTMNANNTAGTIQWTPPGTFHGDITVVAVSGPFDTEVDKIITLNITDRAPVVTAPATVPALEGAAISFTVTAADPDGQAINSLTASSLPFGSSFVSNAAHTSGTFSWTPDFAQAGTYPVTFSASNTRTGSATTTITVADVNRAPVANPGGPYSGVAGVAIAFNGSGSSDPDGDPLTYAWDFGDAMSATGATPSHTYTAGGNYTVSLTVADNGSPSLMNTATTSAMITSVFDARVFTSGGNKSIRLGSGKPTWCAEIEPVGGNFAVGDIDLGSIILVFGANHISALSGKTELSTDSDKNGVPELEACFAKDGLRTLFAGLANGHNTVTVQVQGSLASGAQFTGSLQIDVVSNGSTLSASLSPNPFNPSAVLTFKTEKAGPVRVRLYDTNGRLVRTLLDLSDAAAGYHDVRVDGHSESGEHLASGVYFYRIETADGDVVGRASIVK